MCIRNGKIQNVTVLYESIIDIHLGWLQYIWVSWNTTHCKEKKEKSKDCAVHFPLKLKWKPILLLSHRKYLLGWVHNERMERLEYLRNTAKKYLFMLLRGKKQVQPIRMHFSLMIKNTIPSNWKCSPEKTVTIYMRKLCITW